MRRTSACGIGLLLLVSAAGCASHPPGPPPATASAAGLTVPLVIQGQDTRFRLSFPSSGHGSDAVQFEQGEICYLSAGDFRIECYANGSYLTLGPNDSNALLSDNATIELSAGDGNKTSEQAVRLYGILFLVGGSVERLPQALSDYLQEPGTHLNEAISLAQALMGRQPVDLRGHARGGAFNVAVVLTDAGREKLIDALDSIGESGGDTQVVSARKGPAARHAHKAQPVKSARGH